MNIQPYAVVFNDKDRDHYHRQHSVMICESEAVAESWANWMNTHILGQYDKEHDHYYSTEPAMLAWGGPDENTTRDTIEFYKLP